MKLKIFLFVIFLISAIIFVTTCRKAGSWLVKKDEPVHSDAMILLMGSIPDRVFQAVDLYQKGLTNKVILVEGSMGLYRDLKARGITIISQTQQVRDAIISLGIPSDSIIILSGDDSSTQMEAIIIREYLANKPTMDTLLLVSSAYHTRRASIIFKATLRKNDKSACILSCPSVYTDFNDRKWWKRKKDIQIVLLEYLKTLNFLLFESRQ